MKHGNKSTGYRQHGPDTGQGGRPRGEDPPMKSVTIRLSARSLTAVEKRMYRYGDGEAYAGRIYGGQLSRTLNRILEALD